mmetsp:Transcript_2138/g.4343  ORF Transcript_2138/g.4343 Transcript_2138/m.4343 type:complete len:610 (+) Transcript_2138:52-1881(+)
MSTAAQLPRANSASYQRDETGRKGADTLQVALAAYIPLKCVDLKKQLFSMYPRESRKQFQDLHTLLETMVNFRHLTVKQRMQEAFWECTGTQFEQGEMPSNQAEKTFVKDFTSLMRRANFELLTNEEYMRSEGDGFILDINSKVDCSKMDDAFFTGYLDEHPELSSEFETFEQRMFVFHRGVGLAVKEGRFVSEKVDLLKDYLIMNPIGWLLRSVTFQKQALRVQPDPDPAAASDDGSEQLRKLERRTLRRVYPSMTKLLYRMFSLVELSEPTYQEVVIMYRRKPTQPKRDEASVVGKLQAKAQKMATQMSGVSKTATNDQVVLKSFVDVPMADLKLCFPDTKVSIPPFELFQTLVLILLSVASVARSLMTGSYNAAMLTVTGMVALKIVSNLEKLKNLKKTLGMKKGLALYDKARNSQEGVMTHMTEMMVEQETMQMLLAYSLLLSQFSPRGATNAELDKACEDHLLSKFNVDVDFDVDYGIRKLREYHMIQTKGNRSVAVSLPRALKLLDKEWDEYFQYSGTDSRQGSRAGSGPTTPTNETKNLGTSSAAASLGGGRSQEDVRRLKQLQEELSEKETLHAAEMKKMKLQQSLLCRKVKELEQTMMEL